MAAHPTRLTILISGSGTNLQSLIDATTSSPPLLPHTTILRVISNRKSAYGLTRAEAANIPTSYHPLLPYKSSPKYSSSPADARAAYDADLAHLILQDKPDLMIMAGFMHIVSGSFFAALGTATPGIKCVNLHPALPGGYVGANGIRDAWERFQEGKLEGGKTGVMVHEVVEEVDRGEAVAVREIEMREGEGLEEFEGRVHGVEHEIIVEGVREASRRLWVERRKGPGE
ncbi:phosphoribosylglycinamide formyltransferase [Viridothelium virens]|uniref:phosphoribosylglycinamide formyltransferase 1 n=1 Tax=Viridothelium virens TaxID=1048519 RepID=A0A6A6HIV9_VIRVR|nr:phosphoribosylglycinamide formyltransferase [Viridothelium virens]